MWFMDEKSYRSSFSLMLIFSKIQTFIKPNSSDRFVLLYRYHIMLRNLQCYYIKIVFVVKKKHDPNIKGKIKIRNIVYQMRRIVVHFVP